MIYAGYLLTCVMGWLLLPSKLDARWAEKAAIAFAAGAFAISIQMFALDLVWLGWNRWTLLVPWGVVAAVRIYRGGWRLSRHHRLRPAWWQVSLIIVMLAPIVVWWPYERVMPLTASAWDAWAIWLFKARAFYLDGSVGSFLARAAEFKDHQPGYPLLVPLYGAFLYTLNGGVDDYALKLVTPCFFVALLGVFHYLARRSGPLQPALVLTAMLACVQRVNFTAFELAGYADTALSLYLLAAAGFLFAWWREGRLFDLAAASLAATAAAWTKNEGQFFLPAVIVIGAAALVRERRGRVAWVVLLAPPAFLMVPWTIVRALHGVQAAGFTMGSSFHFDLFAVALGTLGAKAVRWDLFNLSFVLLAGSAAGAWLLRMPKTFWLLPALAGWHLLGALLAYATGQNDLQWWLGTSADRILAQIVPLALLPPAIVFSEWIEQYKPPKAKRGLGPKANAAPQRSKRRRKAR